MLVIRAGQGSVVHLGVLQAGTVLLREAFCFVLSEIYFVNNSKHLALEPLL